MLFPSYYLNEYVPCSLFACIGTKQIETSFGFLIESFSDSEQTMSLIKVCFIT